MWRNLGEKISLSWSYFQRAFHLRPQRKRSGAPVTAFYIFSQKWGDRISHEIHFFEIKISKKNIFCAKCINIQNAKKYCYIDKYLYILHKEKWIIILSKREVNNLSCYFIQKLSTSWRSFMHFAQKSFQLFNTSFYSTHD